MIPFHERKLIYIGVPKTGSSAIFDAYGRESNMFYRHTPFSEIWWRFPDYKTVGVIRHPVTWVISWYRFLVSYVSSPEVRRIFPMSLEVFVQTWVDGLPFWEDNRMFQHEYLFDDTAGKSCDYILPYQKPNVALDEILGLSSREGVNPGVPHMPEISRRAFDSICEYAERDLELWEKACAEYNVEKTPA